MSDQTIQSAASCQAIPQPAEQFVYLVSRDGLHKIGFSGNPQGRLAQIGGGDLVHTFPSLAAYQVEQELHRKFADVRAEGEWFRLGPGDVEAIRRVSRADLIGDLPSELRAAAPEGMTLSASLATIRRMRGLSQADLAAKAGLSVVAVFHLEQGRRDDPKLSTLAKLADALGVTLDRLAGR